MFFFFFIQLLRLFHSVLVDEPCMTGMVLIYSYARRECNRDCEGCDDDEKLTRR